jgi:hypothetical protein
VGVGITPSLGLTATGHHHGKKIRLVAGDQVFAYAGDQGLADRFRLFTEICAPQIGTAQLPYDYVHHLAVVVRQNFDATRVNQPGAVNSIVAFVHGGAHHCCAYLGELQPWLLDSDHFYVALGSGKQMADPFLRFVTDIFCKKQPNVREAIFLATWTLDHVISTNPGGVAGPVRMAVMEKNGVGYRTRELDETEINEQQEAVASAEQALRNWRDLISGNLVNSDQRDLLPAMRA